MKSPLTLFSPDRNTAHHHYVTADAASISHCWTTEQLFLRVPELRLPESSGRRSRKSQLQGIVVDNENSIKNYVIYSRMLRNVQHKSRIFSENFVGSRLQAELCSCAQCILVHHGNLPDGIDSQIMHQSIPSANIPPGNRRGFAPTFSPVPGFVPSELPGGCPGVGPIIYYQSTKLSVNAA